MRIIHVLLLSSAFLIAGCCPTATPEAEEPEPSQASARGCAAYCAHARDLGCPHKSKSSCEAVCAAMMSGPVPWHLECRTKTTTCAAMDACERP